MFEETKELLEVQYQNWNFHWSRVGNQEVGYCPNHGDAHKPNLYIADKGEGEFFKCFACGFSGKTSVLKNQPSRVTYRTETLKVFNITNRLSTYFVDNLVGDALEDVDANIVKKAREYLNKRSPYLFDYIKDKILVGIIPKHFNTEKVLNFLFEKGSITTNLNDLNPETKEKLLSLDKYAGCMVFIYTDIYANTVQFKFRDFISENEDRVNKKIYTLKFADGAFNLSSIANQDDQFVYVVEGEFDVLTPLAYFSGYYNDIMEERKGKGYVPDIDITQEGSFQIVGAGSVDNIYKVSTKLLDKDYTPIIMPDFDDAGQKAIKNIAQQLKKDSIGKQKALDKIFAVDKRPLNVSGKDLDEIFTTESNPRVMFFNIIKPISFSEINEILDRQQQYEIFNKAKELPNNLQVPYLESHGIKMPFKDNFIDTNPMIDDKIEIPKIKWNSLFPAGALSMIVGEEGSGKTYFALWYAMQMAMQGKKVLFWTTEDVPETFWARGRVIRQKAFSKTPSNLLALIPQNLFINLSEPMYFVKSVGYPVVYEPNDELINYLKNQNYDVILIDPLAFFYGFDENNTTAAQSFMRALKQIVKYTDTSLILIHHVNKESQKEKANATKNKEDFEPNKYMIRGTSGFSAHIRHAVFINRKFVEENSTMELHAWVVKSNFIKEGKIESGLPNNDCIILDVTTNSSVLNKNKATENQKESNALQSYTDSEPDDFIRTIKNKISDDNLSF